MWITGKTNNDRPYSGQTAAPVMLMTTVTLKKWGNSPSIRIPASVMQAAALNVEDKLDLKIDETGQIVLIPLKSKKYSLDVLLSGITPDNVHGKIDFDSPIGKKLI